MERVDRVVDPGSRDVADARDVLGCPRPKLGKADQRLGLVLSKPEPLEEVDKLGFDLPGVVRRYTPFTNDTLVKMDMLFVRCCGR